MRGELNWLNIFNVFKRNKLEPFKVKASLCWKSKFEEIVKNFSSVHFALAFLPLDLQPCMGWSPAQIQWVPKHCPLHLESSLMLSGIREILPLNWKNDHVKITPRWLQPVISTFGQAVWQESQVLHPTKKNPVNRSQLLIRVELGLSRRNNSSNIKQKIPRDLDFDVIGASQGLMASPVFTRAKK